MSIEHPLVQLIVSQPGTADRLLAEHVDDGNAHCKACSSGAPPTWPCTLHHYATAASEVERGRGAGRRPRPVLVEVIRIAPDHDLSGES